MKTDILDKINSPADLRKVDKEDLPQLAQELRHATISAVSKTGGHLGAGLGVVELTVALHYVFNTPKDRLIWDVGHQAYPHKIITKRRDEMSTIRQPGGLSGFTKRDESEYDPFGAGHSSTSVSAALGMNVANKLKNNKSHAIAVIGDGAMSAGMAYEAMNNAGALSDEYYKNNRLIVILNDNDMSIAPPTGAMSHYLSRLASSKSYLRMRDFSKKISNKFNVSGVAKSLRKFEKATKEWWMGGNIFEEMGFYYIGPIDGHNLEVLVPILQNIRDDKSCDPILIHCVTQKGKGYNEVMKSDDKLHAVTKFDPQTGKKVQKSSSAPSYSKIFGKALTNLAKKDKDITAITAAMPSGTGLDIFADVHPDKFFDVGIAEQHAVTYAAGLACEEIKPFVAIYSTFLQRAYDQVVHDVAIQSLPVRFMIDRAGFVGADGATHCGSFDIAYLINLPNFILMAPSNGRDLVDMVNLSSQINDKPCAIRYPRGECDQEIDYGVSNKIAIGRGKILQKGEKVAILSYGTILSESYQAAKTIKKDFDIDITIADARFAKPFDKRLVNDLVKNHGVLITIEEGAAGGFGGVIGNYLQKESLLDGDNIKFRSLFMSDEFLENDTVDNMRKKAGISASNIVKTIKNLL